MIMTYDLEDIELKNPKAVIYLCLFSYLYIGYYLYYYV